MIFVVIFIDVTFFQGAENLGWDFTNCSLICLIQPKINSDMMLRHEPVKYARDVKWLSFLNITVLF